jgi:Asp-tRNA(Asn)/Glu-tRNA(Gln) amidotransferase A subunit family amidase
MDLLELSLVQARERLLRGDFSAFEYAEAMMARFTAESDLNAVLASDRAGLLRKARAQDAAGSPGDPRLPLAGIPLLLKDNINTVSLPTTGGTVALRGRVPPEDASCAARLFVAGALLAGKANMHELAFGITSNNAATGAVRNPWNRSLIAGGSSGGSAAAVAARMVPASLGTDTGASVRLPAALCGVVGFRPSVGRYPRGGVVPISHTRDTPGPLARTVQDIALLDAVLAGDASPLPETPLAGVRLGVPRARCFAGADDGVLQVMEEALRLLSAAGAVLVEVDIPQLDELNAAVGFPVALYELTQDLPAYLRECGYGLNLKSVAAEIASPDVASIVASQLGRDAVTAAAYDQAMQSRKRLQAAYDAYFAGHRLAAMVFPTAVLPARPIGDDDTVALGGNRVPTFATYIRNTDPSSNAGVPGISIPAGLTADGLPVGLELDGPALGDRRLIALARAVEQVLPPMPAPPRRAPA